MSVENMKGYLVRGRDYLHNLWGGSMYNHERFPAYDVATIFFPLQRGWKWVGWIYINLHIPYIKRWISNYFHQVWRELNYITKSLMGFNCLGCITNLGDFWTWCSLVMTRFIFILHYFRFHIGLEDMEATISLSPAPASGRLPHNLLLHNNNADRCGTDEVTTPGRGQIMSYLTKMVASPAGEMMEYCFISLFHLQVGKMQGFICDETLTSLTFCALLPW